MIKVSICIPSYNGAKVIAESIENAFKQEYPAKEILVIDDCSKDNTVDIIKQFPEVRLIQNEKNISIGMNLVKLMNEAHGKYVVYLSQDDLFTNPKVVSDIVYQFDHGDPAIGVIGHYAYQFMNGYPGAIAVLRDKNIITSSCNPSGLAFRKDTIKGTNKIFIEMPSIVAEYLKKWRWSFMEWDTIAIRIKPGQNTCTLKEYYVESPTENWVSLIGEGFTYYPGLIQIKNRAPQLLWKEIKLSIKYNKKVVYDWQFWLFVLTALFVPGFILRPFSNFWRHRIKRHFCKIIERPE